MSKNRRFHGCQATQLWLRQNCRRSVAIGGFGPEQAEADEDRHDHQRVGKTMKAAKEPVAHRFLGLRHWCRDAATDVIDTRRHDERRRARDQEQPDDGPEPGNTASSTIDGLSTMVLANNMVKVISWYDNESGYSARCIDLALHMHSKGL